jgi:hypothetical protein
MRAGFAGLLVALVVLAGAAPARGATGPVPDTASTPFGSVAPVFGWADVTRLADGATLIVDGFPRSLPPLAAAPGSNVVVELSDPVVAARLRIRGREIAPAWTTLLTAMFILPADEELPAPAWLELDSASPSERVSASWGLELVPAVAPPPPPVPPAPPPAAAPEPPASASRLRLSGRRLRVALACPAAALSGCSGTLTLRSRGRRVARLPFTNVAAGTRRTLTATVGRATRRDLRRVTSVRAELAVPGRPLAVTRLRLR